MNTNDYTIRLEKPKDYRVVENLVRESFWNGSYSVQYAFASKFFYMILQDR